jgi:hypothetical protein
VNSIENLKEEVISINQEIFKHQTSTVFLLKHNIIYLSLQILVSKHE